MFKQLRDANTATGYVGGWCLKFVQDAFGTDHPYASAIDAWNANYGGGNHAGEVPPLGITVPVYFSLGNVPAGHVAIRLDDGWVASSTQSGSHSTPYFHKSLDDLIAVYGQYNGGCTYLGWSEYVGTVRVVAPAQVNATDDQIRQAYLDILERPADDGAIVHYRNYTSEFVRNDLMASAEHQTLLANKQAQADAIAQTQALAESKAKEDAEKVTKITEAQAIRDTIVTSQVPPVPVPPVTPITPLWQIWIITLFNFLKGFIK